jgi:histidinol dehydrogenase
MPVQRLTATEIARLGGPAGAAGHIRSLVPAGTAVEAPVREIVDAVRAGGDEAVLTYTRKFDTAGGEPRPLLVSPEELDAAIKELPLELVAALQVTIANVALVAQAGAGEDVTVALPQGHTIRVREVPVGSAAVYVPGGRAPYPSTVIMGVVTARAAGVLDVAVCSPPGADGEIDNSILGACRLCGVERVYRMGGAQAIAALAFGTDTVVRADVVVGPGNLYVQEAKRLLSATVGIDGFAGPSELLVLLGAHATAQQVRLAALDMLAQAEHGQGSLAVGVCGATEVGDMLAAELERLRTEPPSVDGSVLVLLNATDAGEAVAFANELAPEHLQLMGEDIEALALKIRSAGCVFVGASSATAFGDYVAGSNHVLPTGGAARFASTLSARHFRRRMAEVRIGSREVAKLAKSGASIARAEGFEWHARSMEARIGDNPSR